MLTYLTAAMRRSAVVGLVAAYALCLLAASTALAGGDLGKVVPCVSQQHHGLAGGPAHDGDSFKGSHDGVDRIGALSDCCGLLCIPALAPAAQADFARLAFVSVVRVLSEDAFPGCGPDQLYRPPIPLRAL